MSVDVDKLDIYNNSAIILDKKTPSRIISWITILVISLILFILVSFIPFNIYKSYLGYMYVADNDSFFTSIIEYSDFPVKKDKKLYIKGKKYDYEVISIDDSNLVLKIYNASELEINNNIATLNILEDRTTIFNIVKNKLKKGFGL